MKQFPTPSAAGIRPLQGRLALTAKRAVLIGVSVLLTACNPLKAFDPVTLENENVFAIQARDVSRATTGTMTYTWTNSEAQATVYHATATRGAGCASIRITDAAGTLVYSAALMPDGKQPTLKGVPGTWTIVITMTGYTGTLAFNILSGV
jgi:hypothetical protein